MSEHRGRRRWRPWLYPNGARIYPWRVQVACVALLLAWQGLWIGVPYLLGVTWPWHYGRLTGPALTIAFYIPLSWWLHRHGYDEPERTSSEGD